MLFMRHFISGIILFLFLGALVSSCDRAGSENFFGPEYPDTSLFHNPVIPDFEVRSGMNLVGRVKDGSAPVAGILVSDGYSIAETDEDGIYQMKRNDDAKFVFVIAPSDYEYLRTGSLPAFYQALDQSKDVVWAYFSLNKRPVPVTEQVLVAIADPQVGYEGDISRFENETVKDVNAVIGSFPAATTVSSVMLGDAVFDRMDYYPGYRAAIEKLDAPVFHVIGNHDYDQTVTGRDSKAAWQYERWLGPTYYSYNIGDCHFVVLDNIIYNGVSTYSATVSSEQLEWLQKDLQYVPKDKLIILSAHIPIKTVYYSTTNNARLLELLQGYNVRFLSGHSHFCINSTISAEMEEDVISAACGVFWFEDTSFDGSPNGYAIYEISGNKIVNAYYKGTNRDKNYQMRLYTPGSWPSKNNSVIANIWNWNPNRWTLEVYENGVLKKNGLTRYVDYDPFLYPRLYGPEVPAKFPHVEPITTNHLFYYTPSAAWNTVKVVAKDQWGNVYQEEINR